MTGKYKILLPLLLIFLLVGCGKTDDGLTIEGHDWTYANAIDSEGQPLDLPALTCAAQDGTLTVTDSDGSTQSGTYTLTQRDANDVLYDLTLDSETGTALGRCHGIHRCCGREKQRVYADLIAAGADGLFSCRYGTMNQGRPERAGFPCTVQGDD